jgi:lysozyme family protein
VNKKKLAIGLAGIGVPLLAVALYEKFKAPSAGGGGGLFSNLLPSSLAQSAQPALPQVANVDPSLDPLTTQVVAAAIAQETDPKILTHLATVLSAAGFNTSAQSVLSQAQALGNSSTVTSGWWSDLARTVGLDTDAMTNADVQSALNALGYGPLRVDGVVGPKTIEAMHRFQQAAQVPLTPYANQETVSALRYSLYGGMAPSYTELG